MPRPEKHVFVCTQQRPPGHPRGSCAQRDCASIMEEFLWQVQQQELFGRIQVTATGCMGPCSEGPSVLVYPDGVMYGNIRKADVATIIDQHLLNGKPVDSLLMNPEFWS